VAQGAARVSSGDHITLDEFSFTVTATAPPPSISLLSPSSYPANNNNQSMQINGSNCQSGATVTFHDPQGNAYPNKQVA